MKCSLSKTVCVLALVTVGSAWTVQAQNATGTASPKAKVHTLPKSEDGDVVLGLCDGETTLEVEGVKDGQALERPKAQAVSDALMAQWRKKNPDKVWVAAGPGGEPPKSASPPKTSPAPSPETDKGQSASTAAPQVKVEGTGPQQRFQSGHTYGNFSDRDEEIWRESTQDVVTFGHKVFHDAKELGGTIGVSCDMCHPDAANTHPETYPKYQVQLGRVAMLRDMINWCLENPVRAKPISDEDPKMRAMEAYIYAQRRGTPLEYGRH
jgi:thiosulfate dehydrogenase